MKMWSIPTTRLNKPIQIIVSSQLKPTPFIKISSSLFQHTIKVNVTNEAIDKSHYLIRFKLDLQAVLMGLLFSIGIDAPSKTLITNNIYITTGLQIIKKQLLRNDSNDSNGSNDSKGSNLPFAKELTNIYKKSVEYDIIIKYSKDNIKEDN